METDYMFEAFLLIVVVPIIVFLICRELLCWYWKVNDQLAVLKSIDKKLDNLATLEAKLDKMTSTPEFVKVDSDL